MSNPSLEDINQKILPSGQTFQPVTLPDGTKLPTGTVATLLHNIRLYDQSVDNAEKTQLEGEMKMAIPLLKKLGFFDLFTPDEWMPGKSPGRGFVGEQVGRMVS